MYVVPKIYLSDDRTTEIEMSSVELVIGLHNQSINKLGFHLIIMHNIRETVFGHV